MKHILLIVIILLTSSLSMATGNKYTFTFQKIKAKPQLTVITTKNSYEDALLFAAKQCYNYYKHETDTLNIKLDLIDICANPINTKIEDGK